MPRIIANETLDEQTLRELSRDEKDWVYNALDVCVTLEVRHKLAAAMDPVAANTASFSHALMAPILEMAMRGTLINEAERDKVATEFRLMHKKLEHNLKRIVCEGIGWPKEFNYRSDKGRNGQVQKLLYGIMGLKPILKRNSKGQYIPTCDRDALEKLQRHWSAAPICRHLLALRELDKKLQLLDTGIDDDHRMRTSYNIAGTNTGRLSSSESDYGTGTNNQNIERKLRSIFTADPGMKFCNIDLEQADSRNVGAICWNLFVESHGEEYAGSYLDACESGDLHTAVCRMAWTNLDWGNNPALWREIADQIFYREFTYRDMAKRLGHGTNFLGTPRTMAHHTKVLVTLIEAFQRQYFEAFPVIGDFDKKNMRDDCWHAWVQQQLRATGQLITPFFGRRRTFYGRENDMRTLREAVAYCPQSMTADEIDTGLLRIWRKFPIIQLLIQVHDSILFQFPEELEADLIPQIMKELEVKFTLKRGREFFVPVEAKVGWNWADEAEDNPSGLIKWTGPGCDERTRPTLDTRGRFDRLFGV